MMIDAFTRVNHFNLEEVKAAIFLGGAHGIKVCFNLPWAFTENLLQWDIPGDQAPIGKWTPGSWGGHSMYAYDYDKNWIYGPHSWDLDDYRISWKAFSMYCAEAYLPIDKIVDWKKKPVAKLLDLTNLKASVNQVSSVLI